LASSGWRSRAAVTGAYLWSTSGIGPDTGAADAGAMVCCARAVPKAVIAIIAVTHTPFINLVVSNMASPPFSPLRGWRRLIRLVPCSVHPDSEMRHSDVNQRRFRLDRQAFSPSHGETTN
jgi:hypothetical protein